MTGSFFRSGFSSALGVGSGVDLGGNNDRVVAFGPLNKNSGGGNRNTLLGSNNEITNGGNNVVVGDGNSTSAFETVVIGSGYSASNFGEGVVGVNALRFGMDDGTISDSALENGQGVVEAQEGSNQFQIRYRDSNGTLQTGTIAFD